MSKNIQIDTHMFLNIYQLLQQLGDYELDQNTRELCQEIENQINAKIDAMERRDTYSQYKTASSNEEREEARQKYLDLIGMHEDWRWNSNGNSN